MSTNDKSDKSIAKKDLSYLKYFTNSVYLKRWARKNVKGGSFTNDNGTTYNVPAKAAFDLYCYIAEMSAGFGQSLTTNLSYDMMMQGTMMSRPTTYKTLKYLLGSGYIKRVKSNHAKIEFKEAYKYMLNFNICDTIEGLDKFPYVEHKPGDIDTSFEEDMEIIDSMNAEAKEFGFKELRKILAGQYNDEKGYKTFMHVDFEVIKDWVKENKPEFFHLFENRNDEEEVKKDAALNLLD